jgi:hypothetical protein
MDDTDQAVEQQPAGRFRDVLFLCGLVAAILAFAGYLWWSLWSGGILGLSTGAGLALFAYGMGRWFDKRAEYLRQWGIKQKGPKL